MNFHLIVNKYAATSSKQNRFSASQARRPSWLVRPWRTLKWAQDSPALAWLPITTSKKKNVIPLRGYHIFKTKSVCRLASSAPFVARPPVADT
ncbi:MAG TPA: hypothetical protein DEE98_04505 [Elusimicrobia bacterium]|nr:MAG: hypothetical protein A2278_04200 [Elusimicrobia bacterium RIFOXYA12_FULL_49_49]OGS14746.1 MAG: hypothetical protein A2251_09645 [Elusimicrobia bacterium RIFOXYA2_FULL_47_53]OGS30114.1 MAG: hypothetical protein A2323_01570 [Elusimicrobia bacterium RIFOXYB2_FULL_46_23]HBU69628.1 hypothetical protein [Elusimicrobiota bacterium]